MPSAPSKQEMAMGSAASRSWARFWTRRERRLLLVGLDAAGKTTILYHMRLGKAIASIPTLGFNVETVKYDGLKLHLWVCARRCPCRAVRYARVVTD